jgi:Coenzyme PQQ synthesis protein D (PqqD)
MKMLHSTFSGRPSESVRHTQSQDGAVLLDVEQGFCFGVNPVGSQIWTLMKEGRSLDEIVYHLAGQFRMPKDELRADVLEFAATLQRHGLLVSSMTPSDEPGGRLGNILRWIRKQW